MDMLRLRAYQSLRVCVTTVRMNVSVCLFKAAGQDFFSLITVLLMYMRLNLRELADKLAVLIAAVLMLMGNIIRPAADQYLLCAGLAAVSIVDRFIYKAVFCVPVHAVCAGQRLPV